MDYFKGIGPIAYEGPESDNPLAFRYYNPLQEVAGRPMKELFKFSMAYWHTLCGTGGDPFGPGTLDFAWDRPTDPTDRYRAKADAAVEFLRKMGLDYFCFHDVDVADYTNDVVAFERRLEGWVNYIKPLMQQNNLKVLWGTANLFSNPRYMNGAATNPNFAVVAHAGAQVRAALDATLALGGENYVFWGGREGYMSLLNTNMKREQEHLARFLHMARDYARSQGFKGTFFIEPKPCEPTKHQYDYDAATVISFLRQYDLLGDFKLNLEVNHATLAGHTFAHELQVAADAGLLGSMDANRGDYQNGWDTDQFPNDVYELTEAMLIVLEAGGLQGGGVNFDAKVRRNSTDPADLFYAHIGAMDVFAKAALVADKILKHSDYRKIRAERYASFDSGSGQQFAAGKLQLTDLRAIALEAEPELRSGRQEFMENLINRYIL